MSAAAPNPGPLLLALAAVLAGSAAAGQAHVHGEARLEITLEPRSVTLRLETPQDNLLGHERTPRTATELQAAAAVLQRLHDGAGLFGLPADHNCRLAQAEVEAPRLQPGGAAPGAAGHADVEARYRFDCAATDGLRSLAVGALFDAFPRLQRLQAQLVTPGGQHLASARRPARVLAWGR